MRPPRGLPFEKPGLGVSRPGFSQHWGLISAASEVTRRESPTSAADIYSTCDRIGCSYSGVRGGFPLFVSPWEPCAEELVPVIF